MVHELKCQAFDPGAAWSATEVQRKLVSVLFADLAVFGLPQAREHDPERARQIYQHSLAIFTEMGAPGLIFILESRLQDFN